MPDSLLAEVVPWGQGRDQAPARMRRALRELRVVGPGMHTTAPLLAEILDEPDFVAGRHDTTLLDRRAQS
ncbi:hypothetical protein [Streptomyces sp. SID3343]|uniref:hypothetical protein n=1 Tax=Streptomyces sp. SID3343 TaxID=2690260 RepID=UPI0031F9354A